MKKRKAYWEMTTEELAEATRQYDDPRYEPAAVRPTSAQVARLRKWQRYRSAARARMSLSLEKSLIEQADKYAADHGQSVSELVADALRHWMKKRSA